jgi:hypothetical protein
MAMDSSDKMGSFEEIGRADFRAKIKLRGETHAPTRKDRKKG